MTFRDVFAAWFLNGTAPQTVIDDCTTWRCGTCSTKHSTKGGKLKPGHGADSPAALLAAEIAAGNLTALAPPAPGHPDPWGWSAAAQAASDPLPAACTAAGLTPTLAPIGAPAAAPEPIGNVPVPAPVPVPVAAPRAAGSSSAARSSTLQLRQHRRWALRVALAGVLVAVVPVAAVVLLRRRKRAPIKAEERALL